ncbi:hypothetical protein SADUNF_Sadunf01G0132500 [Salix dunnii]|uniref:Uncharacterized protein n=1 Tax=Salix dunnii TaxID=1413687 RepID=A0A835TMN1_9ROSI|nr:hypothetical protein SADUNF_Sadunf01G0132500 [Salix dunnii]
MASCRSTRYLDLFYSAVASVPGVAHKLAVPMDVILLCINQTRDAPLISFSAILLLFSKIVISMLAVPIQAKYSQKLPKGGVILILVIQKSWIGATSDPQAVKSTFTAYPGKDTNNLKPRIKIKLR